MHSTLLKVIEDMGGICTTSELMNKHDFPKDKRIYSSLDLFAKTGHLEKKKNPAPGKRGNIWLLKAKGKEVLKEKESELLSVEDYKTELAAYRKAHPDKTRKSQKKVAVATAKPAPKKITPPPMPNMSEAAIAAVEGIAKVIDNGQRSYSLIVQIHRLCDDYINNKN